LAKTPQFPNHHHLGEIMSLNSKITCSAITPKGRYANYFKIGHSSLEVVLDFGQCYPEEEAQFHTRIITTPSRAKALLETLQESLARYEQDFGGLND
jgi:hypothetical protein